MTQEASVNATSPDDKSADFFEKHVPLECYVFEEFEVIQEFCMHIKNIDIVKEQQNCEEIGNWYQLVDTGTLPDDVTFTNAQLATVDQYAIKDNVLIHLYQPRTRHMDRYYPITTQIVLPKRLRPDILSEYHDSLVRGGHQAFDRVYAAIRSKYYWPKMYTDILQYQRTCLKCQQASHHHPKPPPLNPLPVPELFQTWHMDFIGPLKTSSCGKKWILLCVDSFSRWCEAFALPSSDAVTVAKVLYTEIFARYGAPRTLISDRGANFLSTLVRALCDIFNVKRSLTSPFHPMTNAACERMNSFINKSLRTYVKDDQTDWPLILPGIMLAYRSTPAMHSTHFSPYFLLFGQEYQSPLDRAINPNITTVTPQYREHLKTYLENIQVSREIAKENIERHQEYNKAYYDQKTAITDYKIGDFVWLLDPRTPVGYSRKLRVRWTGPYVICEIGLHGTYRLRHYHSHLVTPTLINAQRLKPARMHTESRLRNYANERAREGNHSRPVARNRGQQDELPDARVNVDQRVNQLPQVGNQRVNQGPQGGNLRVNQVPQGGNQRVNQVPQGGTQRVKQPQQPQVLQRGNQRVNRQVQPQNSNGAINNIPKDAKSKHQNVSRDKMQKPAAPTGKVIKVTDLRWDKKGKWYRVKFEGVRETAWYLEDTIDIPLNLIKDCLKKRTWRGTPRKR